MPAGSIAYTTVAAADTTSETTFFSSSLPASALVAGDNVIAVEVHQRSGSSSDVSFDLELIGNTTGGSGASVTRGPYLQMAAPTAMTIRWRTDSATDSRVQYGTTQGSLNLFKDSGTVTTEHEVRLADLNPETTYYYSVGSTTGVQAGNDAATFFKTGPATGTARPTRIWVIGDAGTANSSQTAVYNAYKNFTGSTYTNLWLQLGDNAYNSGTDSEFQAAVFNMYPALLKQSPTWPTLGNHDGGSADSPTQTGPYYDIFSLPKNAESGGTPSGTEAYYSFDYGNIHFVVLDSYDTSRSTTGAMMNWLKSDLQNSTSDWLIAFWHHPPYSKGSHNSDTESNLIDMRQNFLPVLEEHGVDLVLAGHSHSYERSFLLDGHYGSSSTFTSAHKVDGGSGRVDGTGAYTKSAGNTPHDGAVYAVAGSSGQISGGTLNHPAMYLSLNELGSMVLDVDGNTLNAKFLNSSGTTRDYFTLVKGGSAPASCPLPWGGSLADGQSVTAYQTNVSTDCPSVAQTRTCADGTLSGSYTFATCAAPPSGSVTVTLQNGLNGYAGNDDAMVASKKTTTNYGSATTLVNDLGDNTYGDQISLLKWSVTGIPANATVQTVDLGVQVSNKSAGSYNVYAYQQAWAEGTATWGNQNPNSYLGSEVGVMTFTSTGAKTLSLNAAGVTLVQGWVNGSVANNGLAIKSAGTTDGLDLRSSEYGTQSQRPKLTVKYTQ
jgi:hypothetical protein